MPHHPSPFSPKDGSDPGFANPAFCSNLKQQIAQIEGDIIRLQHDSSDPTGHKMQIQQLSDKLNYLSQQFQAAGCSLVPIVPPNPTYSGIRVLLVLDDSTSTFGPGNIMGTGADNEGFALSTVVDTLTECMFPTFFVDKAHRSKDALATFFENNPNDIKTHKYKPEFEFFHFDNIDLNAYDEIWLFGITMMHEINDGPMIKPGNPGKRKLSIAEITAIAHFMENGGGIFATGDHWDMGAPLCGFIPRVRSMRKWFYDNKDLPYNNQNLKAPSALGSDRIDTLRPGHSDPPPIGPLRDIPQYWFDNQSDDIPQEINLQIPHHPLVNLAFGRQLNYLPDHMHEGEVIDPASFDLLNKPVMLNDGQTQLEINGIPITEYPGSEKPVIVATGRVLSHVSPVPDFENIHSSDSDVVNSKEFGIIGAYDGQVENVGRVVVDSTFHHFFDINLIGDSYANDIVAHDSSHLFIDPKSIGFNASPKGRAYLEDIKQYYINIGFWLARSKTTAHLYPHLIYKLLNRSSFRMLAKPNGLTIEEENAIGNLALEAIRNIPEWMILELINAHAETAGIGDSLPKHKSKTLKGKQMHLSFPSAGIISRILGSSMIAMARLRVRQYNASQAFDMSNVLEEGIVTGLKSYAASLKKTGEHYLKLSEQIENSLQYI